MLFLRHDSNGPTLGEAELLGPVYGAYWPKSRPQHSLMARNAFSSGSVVKRNRLFPQSTLVEQAWC